MRFLFRNSLDFSLDGIIRRIQVGGARRPHVLRPVLWQIGFRLLLSFLGCMAKGPILLVDERGVLKFLFHPGQQISTNTSIGGFRRQTFPFEATIPKTLTEAAFFVINENFM